MGFVTPATTTISPSLTVTSVPLGGYGDVFTAGTFYKSAGTSIQRSIYPGVSIAYPCSGAFTALTRTAGLPAVSTWALTAYGGGWFVAIAGGVTAVAASSTDGLTWTQRAMPVAIQWRAVTYGNGRFVAVGDGGSGAQTTICATSLDGVTWTQRVIVNAAWTAVTYSDALALFVAVSGTIVAPSTAAATSPDGVTWTARTLPTSQAWTAAAASPTILVALGGGNATTAYATSTNGTAWTARTLPSGTWADITFAAGLFVATATDSGRIITSPDGLTWTAAVLPANITIGGQTVTYGNNLFIVTGSGLSTNLLLSNDGVVWENRTLPSTTSALQACFGVGVFFLPLGSSSNNFISVYAENLTDSDWFYLNATAGKYVRVK